jgi:hypothetical protein
MLRRSQAGVQAASNAVRVLSSDAGRLPAVWQLSNAEDSQSTKTRSVID